MKDKTIELLKQGNPDKIEEWLLSFEGKYTKPLLAAIDELFREIWERGYQEATPFERKWIIAIALVCLPYSRFQKIRQTVWILDADLLERIIELFCPDWFSSFVSEMAKAGRITLDIDYPLAIRMARKGYIHLEPELSNQLLPRYLFTSAEKHYVIQPEKLLEYPETLQTHIWHFFTHASELHGIIRFHFSPELPRDNHADAWQITLVSMAEKKWLPRQKLIQHTLLACSQPFNQQLNGWFARLLGMLHLTPKEALTHQHGMMAVLGMTYSKVLSVVLELTGHIKLDPAFDVDGFLLRVPALVTHKSKTVITPALNLLEEIGTAVPERKPSLCLLIMQAFIQREPTIQKRVAKLLAAWANPDDISMQDGLRLYAAHLLPDTQQILKPLLISNPAPYEAEPHESIKPTEGLQHLEPLPKLHHFDDFLYLCSQAFENNEPWHFDALPAAILQWHKQCSGNNLQKLQAPLKRALHRYRAPITKNVGTLDFYLAVFFIDCCIHLIRQHPQEAGVLEKLLAADAHKFERKKGWMEINPDTSNIARYYHTLENQNEYLSISLLCQTIYHLKKGIDLHLLCTPTHMPCWIEPVLLSERFLAYQKQGIPPEKDDVWCALMRCLHPRDAATKKALQKIPTHAYTGMLLYLCGIQEQPDTSDNKDLWEVACWIREHKQKLDVAPKEPTPPDNMLMPNNMRYWAHTADIKRMLMQAPHYTDAPLLHLILRRSLTYPRFWEAEDTHQVKATIEALLAIGFGGGATLHELLAKTLVVADRHVNQMAMDLWIQGTVAGTINQPCLGTLQAKLITEGYATPQRVADLIASPIFDLPHALRFEAVKWLDALLEHLPEVPVKNLKKLTQLYKELVKATDSAAISQGVQEKMAAWKL